jgi:hypothetical protein
LYTEEKKGSVREQEEIKGQKKKRDEKKLYT